MGDPSRAAAQKKKKQTRGVPPILQLVLLISNSLRKITSPHHHLSRHTQDASRPKKAKQDIQGM